MELSEIPKNFPELRTLIFEGHEIKGKERRNTEELLKSLSVVLYTPNSTQPKGSETTFQTWSGTIKLNSTNMFFILYLYEYRASSHYFDAYICIGDDPYWLNQRA
jgi:hypothetical protein